MMSTFMSCKSRLEPESTVDETMSAESSETASEPYKCVMCNIEIHDRSEIGGHLKACRLVHGGLHMTENGPQHISFREQHADTLVSICKYDFVYRCHVVVQTNLCSETTLKSL